MNVKKSARIQACSQTFQKGGVELACMLVSGTHVQEPPFIHARNKNSVQELSEQSRVTNLKCMLTPTNTFASHVFSQGHACKSRNQ